MRLAPRMAVSLYVALVLHALLLLGLALRPPSQNSAGPGLGLSVPGAGLSEAERWLATAPPAAGRDPFTVPETEPAAGIADPRSREPIRAKTRKEISDELPKRPAQVADGEALRPQEKRSGLSVQRIAQAGGGGSANSYYARLRAHLAGFRHELPAGLPAASARVRFRVSPDGWISELELVQGSGVASLDAEALDLFRRAAPLPPPPDARDLRLIVPVSIDGPG